MAVAAPKSSPVCIQVATTQQAQQPSGRPCGTVAHCQDARKPRQRIRGIHLQRHAFTSLALYLTVTTRYHTLGPVEDPQQAGKSLNLL
jgi:hypothetical protein